MAHRNRLADFPDRESSPKARGRASVSVRTPRKQGDSARQRRKQHTPSPYFRTAWGSLAPVVLRSALTRSSKERDGERCRWRTRATSPEAHHSSKEREIHGMATCTVLTIRIYTNGAQRSASGAVFLDPAWSIPMIQITFPPVSAKFVRLSVNLPTQRLYIHKGDPYDTHRFSHCPAGRQRTRDHRDWSHVRSLPFLSRVVRLGWRQALSAPGEGFRYRLVQKRAQDTDQAQIGKVLEKFRDKYGRNVKSYYPKLHVAAEVPLE